MMKRSKMKIPCIFLVYASGKTFCKVHKQSLLYIYGDKLICSDGEDFLISKFGWDKYHMKMKEQPPQAAD